MAPKLLFVLLFVGLSCSGRPDYTPKTSQNKPYPDFSSFLEAKLAESKAKGHRPLCEERYIEQGKKTKLAFLYIHGFGASRQEGEETVEKLSKQFKANAYLLRLPGHGTNPEDHAEASFRDYLDAGREALLMLQEKGEKIIVFGSSMGGLIATYLASEYPEEVDGLVLANPFYQPVDGSLNIFNYPGGLTLVHILKGKVREASYKNNPKVSPERDSYWYGKQYYKALVSVNDLRNYASRPEVFHKVKAPVLLLYYYKSEQEQDPTASVKAMRSAFLEFGKPDKTSPLNKEVAIEDGMHVLMSRYVQTDKLKIEKESTDWLKQVANSQ